MLDACPPALNAYVSEKTLSTTGPKHTNQFARFTLLPPHLSRYSESLRDILKK